MKLKKPLKDPNEKSDIQKFVGGKIPHYLAVAAFLYAFVGTGGFLLGMITGAAEKERKELDDYILKVVAEDTEDYSRIHRQHLTRLPGVAQMQSSFALRTVFKTTALPI